MPNIGGDMLDWIADKSCMMMTDNDMSAFGIFPGDYVLLARLDEPVSGDIIAYMKGDEVHIGRLEIHPGRRWWVEHGSMGEIRFYLPDLDRDRFVAVVRGIIRRY